MMVDSKGVMETVGAWRRDELSVTGGQSSTRCKACCWVVIRVKCFFETSSQVCEKEWLGFAGVCMLCMDLF